jgi:ABC-type phosphate/phosphonate transport system substrate-binding protein
VGLLQDVENVFDALKAKLGAKVPAEVTADVHGLIEDGKAQATQLLKEAGADASADAAKAAGDASTVAADTATAVNPASK